MTQQKPLVFISYGRGDDHDDDLDESFLKKLDNNLIPQTGEK